MRPIDLLPDLKILRREQALASLPRLLLVALLIWALLLSGAYAWVYLQRQAVQAQLNDVTQQVEALEPVAQRVQQVAFLNGQVHDLQSKLDANTAGNLVPLLDLLSSLMPAQVTAQQLSWAAGQVSLSCSSRDLAAIGRFQNNLQQTTGVNELHFSVISAYSESSGEGIAQTTASGFTFSVTFQYGGN